MIEKIYILYILHLFMCNKNGREEQKVNETVINKRVSKNYFLIFKIVILSILFIFSGLMIFKNSLFFSREILASFSIDESIMASYENCGSYFSPVDGATIYLHDFDVNGNEVQLIFDEALEEDTFFSVYNSSSDMGQYVIEQKRVRKGCTTVAFYFESTHFDTIKILAHSLDGSHFVNIPTGTINVNYRITDILQYNLKYAVTVILIVLISVEAAVFIGIKDIRDKNRSISRNNRESNFELLRVICMFLLVAYHYAVHGGLLNLEFSLPKYVGLAFLPVGKICFIAFVAISMYFLADGHNQSKRFLKCWLEVAFYSVLLTAVTWALGGVVNFRDLISSFFVMISNSHGFAASYLLFLLIYPFMLKATKGCSKKQARYLLLVVFWIQILSQIFKVWTGYTQPVFSELTLFIFCYILSMNLKRYPVELLDNKLFDLMVVVAIYTYVYAVNMVVYTGGLNKITNFLRGITVDESSIFFIIGGYALFYLFKNIHMPHSNFINTVAGGTFGILLIHDHNFFRHLFWNEVIRTQTYFHSNNFIIWFMVTVIAVFIVCFAIDFLRKKLLEQPVIYSRQFKQVVVKIEEVFSNEKELSGRI